MKPSRVTALFAYFLLFAFSSCVFSQEHHYWSNQFGSRSALMSGAVVGGVRDTSAGYYNPATLGFLEDSSFSVSGNAYKLEWTSIDNGAGTGESLDSLSPQMVPSLLSGTFQIGNNTFGYSVLAKHMSSIDMAERMEWTGDYYFYNQESTEARPFDGEEEYRGQFLFNSELSETWAGISWAQKVRNNISLGVSGFLALRTQSVSFSQFARLVNTQMRFSPNSIATQDRFRNFDFYNVRGLLKLAVAADFDTLKLGATLTMPSISLFGRGNTAFGAARIDPKEEKALIIDDRQEDLDADYKTPLSLAIGLEYAVNQKTRLASTVEWFAKQDRYDIITPVDKDMVVGGSGGRANSRDLLIEDAAESVVNVALAIEHAFTNNYKGYLSFNTDFETTANDVNNIMMGVNRWDIYHITAGMTHKSKESELALGLTYSFGNQDEFPILANLDVEDYEHKTENNLIPTIPKNTSANYHAFGVIVGYTYFFK